VRPGENTVELRNTGSDPVTVTEARLALDLPSVPPTVFPDLPEEQCIHVSPEGSDENPGTLDKPVQSAKGIEKCFSTDGRGERKELILISVQVETNNPRPGG
jgi:hypothetical protein